MELATALLWTLRVILPIILFCVYFKLQPKDDSRYGPTDNVADRVTMLAHRKAPAVREAPVPEEMDNLTLVDASQAPALFETRTRGARGAGKRGPGATGGGAGHGEDLDPSHPKGKPDRKRETREPRETRTTESKASTESRRVEAQEEGEEEEEGESHREIVNNVEVPEVQDEPAPRDLSEFSKEPVAENRAEREIPSREMKAPKSSKEPKEPKESKESRVAKASNDKMYLESLVNHVAFHRKEQPRTFLPDEASLPPPPPRAKKFNEADSRGPKSAALSEAAMAKANEEAQMVLKGALKINRPDVAHNLYAQLLDSQVDVAEGTFSLLIQAAIDARDLKTASDLLMKMEAAGFHPETEMLDKVMDLYVDRKSQRKQEKQKPEDQGDNKGDLAPPAAERSPEPSSYKEPAMNPYVEPAKPYAEPVLGPFTEPPAQYGEGLPSQYIEPETGQCYQLVAIPYMEQQGAATSGCLAQEAYVREESRAKLSSEAPIFKPKLSSDASAFVPALCSPGSTPPPPPARIPLGMPSATQVGERTRLKRSARPFQPQGVMVDQSWNMASGGMQGMASHGTEGNCFGANGAFCEDPGSGMRGSAWPQAWNSAQQMDMNSGESAWPNHWSA
mmetsp:Transcript_72977/g.158373  ORF Transcript_72977/g.158373 Transcript_72977/m.158373 type:complete len:620 (-) Transcript_72977:79-1938(-)|eukprot:CAMPEP_0170603180 /NCGR_PEP_ID=MMETSP0224-20130122/18778_1 /TAXON_ID=285029 /ORGANISM="Togula jolla, Strain CCCM 725" /LENGTH=619 /DNA_ID=CAMNT_0010928051 /DNA_START=57 /DNA_END=1916 /DNA_ORIENTATION=-